ncbi:MAG: molybdopterin dinucleotide binding domain-containing protein [Ignavibacteria bacterium]
MKAWYGALNDGVVSVKKAVVESAGETETVTTPTGFKPEAFTAGSQKMTPGSDFVVLLTRNSSLGDGRFANNGWLQELPKSVSRVAWDNYAAISVQDAKEMGLESNDLIKITTAGGELEIPVFIQPGAAKGVLAIELGYGRSECGTVGKDVGFNANKLMSKNSALTPWLMNDAKVSKAGGTYQIVTTQDHYAFDEPLYKDIQYRRDHSGRYIFRI